MEIKVLGVHVLVYWWLVWSKIDHQGLWWWIIYIRSKMTIYWIICLWFNRSVRMCICCGICRDLGLICYVVQHRFDSVITYLYASLLHKGHVHKKIFFWVLVYIFCSMDRYVLRCQVWKARTYTKIIYKSHVYLLWFCNMRWW